ncbi:hypothetical protein AGMMS49928_19950 [Spirochaetia bacterium]|nr:hypothetical protein AGMMS49928_19950 [Spirochaetia bacterium]
MALSDWTSGVNYAHSTGKAEGKIEGKAERSFEIAREMKADGIPMSQIVKFTHLSEDEIAQL